MDSASTRAIPPRMRADWWLRKPGYLLFMLREFSSFFIAVFLGELLCRFWTLAFHPDRYQVWLDWAKQPWIVAFNVAALAFACLHSVTFFQAAATILVVRVGGKRVPSRAISGGHFAGWVVVSAVLGWLMVNWA